MTYAEPSEMRRWTIPDGVEFRRCVDDILAFKTGSGDTHALGGIPGLLCDRLCQEAEPLDLVELNAACSGVETGNVESALIPRESIEDALAELATIGVVREVGP